MNLCVCESVCKAACDRHLNCSIMHETSYVCLSRQVREPANVRCACVRGCLCVCVYYEPINDELCALINVLKYARAKCGNHCNILAKCINVSSLSGNRALYICVQVI